VAAGLYGANFDWEFIGYAVGDVDNDYSGTDFDTWLIASTDGEHQANCPANAAVVVRLAAGEPFNTYNDVSCD